METKAQQKVNITKDFTVPVDQLYKAWIDPEELKQWWKPMGNQLKEVKNDVRVNGPIKYVFENKNGGQAFEIKGAYSEVEENKKLVYSWDWMIPGEAIEESQYKLTILFSGEGTGSKLEVTQENFKGEESLVPHQQGWEQALNDLHQYLSSK